MQRVAFILNPVSGTKNKQDVWSYIGSVFGLSPEYEITMYTTSYAGDGYEKAVQFAKEKFDAVVAIGGDGTVNEVARGLLHTKTALGIIAMGSGNGLARHLHLPLDFRKAIDVIRTAKTQFIDAASINGQSFFCTAGIGFDALIGGLFNRIGKRGLYNYVSLSAKKALQYTPQDYQLEIDGQKLYRRAFLITFANASQWGNNAYIAPCANICDGQLDVVILNAYSMIESPILLPRLFTRSIHKAWAVETFKGEHIKIIRSKDDYVHFDGESAVMGRTLEIDIMPLSLNVIIA